MFENPPGGWRCFLPDGYVVTVCGTGNGQPPGSRGGMGTNSAELWVRLVGPGWDSGWHRCHNKSATKVRPWWQLVVKPGDIPEAWRESTGQAVWPPPRYDDVFFAGVAAMDRA